MEIFFWAAAISGIISLIFLLQIVWMVGEDAVLFIANLVRACRTIQTSR